MKTRFYHARILTMDGTPMFTGELITDGDTILSVGTGRSEGTFDSEIDCRGNLLLPGFKNAHTHSAMTFLRSHADDLPLHEWLYDCVFPWEALLRPGDCYALNRLAILEYLSGGITAQFDMYYHREEVAQAAIDCGFRTVLMNAANDFGGTPEEELEENRKFTAMGPLIRYQFGIHAEYTTRKELIRDVAAAARSVRKPFYAHMNETADEVEGCVERYGMRPFELLESLNAFAYGGGGFHCVHVSDREMEIMKERDLSVITCPGSNLKLGSGVAPIKEYLDRGIRIGIGTDGPASNNCLDMFREMFLVTGLQKIRHGADAVDADLVLKMACSDGARAMGLADCDSLAPGKKADLILIDLNQPNMQPINNISKNIVYSGSKKNVILTMIGGRILYRDGTFFIGSDPETIYEEANRIIRRMEKEI